MVKTLLNCCFFTDVHVHPQKITEFIGFDPFPFSQVHGGWGLKCGLSLSSIMGALTKPMWTWTSDHGSRWIWTEMAHVPKIAYNLKTESVLFCTYEWNNTACWRRCSLSYLPRSTTFIPYRRGSLKVAINSE